MIRKASLVLALVASLSMISGPVSNKSHADDFVKGALGAALIMNGIGSMIQATQPQVNVYAPPYNPYQPTYPIGYQNPYAGQQIGYYPPPVQPIQYVPPQPPVQYYQPVQYAPQPVQYYQQPQQPVQYYQQPQQPVQYYQQPQQPVSGGYSNVLPVVYTR